MAKEIHTPAQQDCPFAIVQLTEEVRELSQEVSRLQLRIIKLEHQIKEGGNK